MTTSKSPRPAQQVPNGTVVISHPQLGLVTIPGPDRPAGYVYLDAWEETADRICVIFQLEGWDQPEVDFFGSLDRSLCRASRPRPVDFRSWQISPRTPSKPPDCGWA